jgi:hypothetical protein
MDQAKNGIKNYFNFRHRLSNNEIRDVDVYSSPVMAKGKNLLFSIIHDITERVKAEKFIKSFFEQPVYLHMISQFDTKIIAANIGWEITSGYTKKEIIRRMKRK